MLKNNLNKGVIMNKLNKLYNSISDNELNNQKTTMSLINEHMIMFNNGSLNMGNQSILTILGAKNGQGIKPIIKGIEQLSIISGHRKAIVNKLLLPIADFSNLVESENTTTPKKTKVEKKKTKEENKQIVEIDYAEKKSNEAIRKNVVRTTANNIVIPILFLASQDKSNYSFNDNKVKIKVKNLSDEVVKSVFGFNKKNADVNSMNCNLALLTKLAKADLFSVKLRQKSDEIIETENLEDVVADTTKSEYSEDKAENIVKGINAMLKYLDNNEGYDYILQVQNHISNLENYGYETENIVEALRKQTNNSVNKDLYGCWVADNSIKLNAKTMEELRKQFNSKFKVAI